MSKRNALAKEIHALEEEIKLLEIKLNRSMRVVIEALVSREQPKDEDLQFFRTFSAEIDVKREQLQKLVKELEGKL